MNRSFSNYGTWVHLGAPGSNVLSTVPPSRWNKQPHYASYSGTSMACPHVSGAAGGQLAAQPTHLGGGFWQGREGMPHAC